MANSKSITPAKGFTSAFLDNLKPKDKRIELADKACPGLRLRLEPTGRKVFVWYFNDGGKNRVLTLGRYGTGESRITLAQARKSLATAKEKRLDGVSIVTPANTPTTVKELSELFYDRRIKPHLKRPESVRLILDNDIIPKLGNKKLRTLTAPTVANMIESVVDRGAKSHAGSVLSAVKQIFNFAEARGYIDHNPATALNKKDLGVVNAVRDRYLTAEEIQALWRALDHYTRLSEQVRIGLKLLLLTGVRTGELLKASWADVDFNKGEWFIPKLNSKTVEWTVPLVPMVLALFRELKGIADDLGSPWVMASPKDGHLSDKALGRALKRLFEVKDKECRLILTIPECHPHDMRRTLRTHLEALGIEPHIAEKCLNHSLGRIERTYNKNTLIEKRREALQKWADYVDLLVTDRANVVRIGGAA